MLPRAPITSSNLVLASSALILASSNLVLASSALVLASSNLVLLSSFKESTFSPVALEESLISPVVASI
jgi:hypothetical protein